MCIVGHTDNYFQTRIAFRGVFMVVSAEWTAWCNGENMVVDSSISHSDRLRLLDTCQVDVVWKTSLPLQKESLGESGIHVQHTDSYGPSLSSSNPELPTVIDDMSHLRSWCIWKADNQCMNKVYVPCRLDILLSMSCTACSQGRNHYFLTRTSWDVREIDRPCRHRYLLIR